MAMAFNATSEDGNSIQAIWTGINENETPLSHDFKGYPDRTVQVVGAFGGATITIQGSTDGTNYSTLTDIVGNSLSFTSASLNLAIAPAPRYIKPVISGGSSTTLTVAISAYR